MLNPLDYFQAIILAILQGITEFLPISSSAHLILVPKLLGWQDQGLAFDVAVHVGTLGAVMVFLKNELNHIIPAWFVGWRHFAWNSDGKLGWMIVVATIPLGIVGLLGGSFIESNLRSAIVIAVTTLMFGLLLGWFDRSGENNSKQIDALTWPQVIGVGFAQALALIPGTSRSGVTMTALLAMGYSRVAAARFSFMMAVPAIALPGMLKTAELVASKQAIAWDMLAIGVLVSGLIAFWCMGWFIRLVQNIGMMPFVIYRILLAIVIVVVLV